MESLRLETSTLTGVEPSAVTRRQTRAELIGEIRLTWRSVTVATVPTWIPRTGKPSGGQATTVPARHGVAMACPRIPASGARLGQNTSSVATTRTAAIGLLEASSLPMTGEAARPTGHATASQGLSVAEAPRLPPTYARSLPDETSRRALLRVAPGLQTPAVAVVLDEP